MQCSQCKTDFCWLCRKILGTNLSQTSDKVVWHYRGDNFAGCAGLWESDGQARFRTNEAHWWNSTRCTQIRVYVRRVTRMLTALLFLPSILIVASFPMSYFPVAAVATPLVFLALFFAALCSKLAKVMHAYVVLARWRICSTTCKVGNCKIPTYTFSSALKDASKWTKRAFLFFWSDDNDIPPLACAFACLALILFLAWLLAQYLAISVGLGLFAAATPVLTTLMWPRWAFAKSHAGFTCAESGAAPIVGTRFRLHGTEYDLCEAEFSKLPAAEASEFVAIRPCWGAFETLNKQLNTGGRKAAQSMVDFIETFGGIADEGVWQQLFEAKLTVTPKFVLLPLRLLGAVAMIVLRLLITALLFCVRRCKRLPASRATSTTTASAQRPRAESSTQPSQIARLVGLRGRPTRAFAVGEECVIRKMPIGAARSLSNGHGGWNPEMERMLGCEGIVESVVTPATGLATVRQDRQADYRVRVGRRVFRWNGRMLAPKQCELGPASVVRGRTFVGALEVAEAAVVEAAAGLLRGSRLE